MSDEQVSQFLMITGSEDGDVAKQFLDMSGNNLEVAISLFFENGGSRMVRAAQDPNREPSSAMPPYDTNGDEDLAQRMQNEAYQQGTSNDDYIRPPDQAVHERLADTHIFPGTLGSVGGSYGPLRRTVGDMFDENRPTDVFNQRLDNYDFINSSSSSDDDFSEDDDNNLDYEYVEEPVIEVTDDGELREYTKLVRRPKNISKEARLAMLFRPPFDIMSKRDFESAKTKAQKKKKWLMINIQDSGIFQCQALNRDLWSSKNIKRLIKKNFIFLQYQFESRDAQRYLNFYNVNDKDELPHIAIIDPITGERLKQWNQTVPSVESFTADINEFLSAFSMDPSHTNPIVKEPLPKIDPTTLTEEQQMEMAIRHSLGNQETIGESDGDQPMEDEADDDIFNSIKPIKHDEPPNKPGITTRIQIRTGDGRRIVKRFNCDEDTVRTIFEVVKSEVEGFESIPFTLTSHDRENLITKLDMSISDAGLKNSSLLLAKEDDE